MKYSFTFIFIWVLTFLFSCSTLKSEQITVIKCGHIFNPKDMVWEKNQTLVIQNGHIIGLNPTNLPLNAHIIDYSSSYIIPGLIDAHTHVFLEDSTYSRDFAKGLHQFMKDKSDAERKLIGEKRLRSLLASGFMSIRDLGNEGGVDVSSLKNDGARIFVTGAGFSPKDGQLPKGSEVELISKEYKSLSDPFPENFPYGVMKVFADEDPNPNIADPKILKAWVEKAHKKNILVAAHGILPKGIDAAIYAGVDTLEHGTHINASQLAQLKEKKIIFVPTFADYLFLLPQGKKYQWDWTPQVTHRTCGNIGMSKNIGVELAFGSDNFFSLESDGLEFGPATLEILLVYRHCGLTASEVIKTATYSAAKTMGKTGLLGELVVGAHADFIVLSQDPTVDLEILRKPVTLYKDGVEVKIKK